MSDLNRIQVGEFNIRNSIKIAEVEGKNIGNFISIEQFFEKNDRIILNSNEITRFLNGVKLLINKENGLYNIYNTNNEFIGIGNLENNLLKRDIVVI